VTDIGNEVVCSGVVSVDWKRSWMVNVYKGKGNALECSSYRGIKLLEHVLKVLERVIEARIRKIVKIDELQFGFSPGKAPQMQSLLYVRSKKSSLGNRRSCGSLLWT